MVEVPGFEPGASWSRTKRATKLRYTSPLRPQEHIHSILHYPNGVKHNSNPLPTGMEGHRDMWHN